MLLAVLGITVILYRVFGPGAIRLEAAPAVEEPAAVAAAQRLDPERYRTAMLAVDQALFNTPATTRSAMNEQIEIAFRQLGRGLLEAEAVRGHAAADAVNALAGLAGTDSLELEVLQQMRADWALARSRHFARAHWYLFPGKQDVRTDRAALAVYRDVAADLLSLLDDGASRAGALAAPTPVIVAGDEAPESETWPILQAEWRERAGELRQQLPGRPDAGGDPQILVAAQRLEQAFAGLTSLAAGREPPALERFDESLETADLARQSFDDLLLASPN